MKQIIIDNINCKIGNNKEENWKKVLIEEAKKEADILIDEKSIVPLGYIKVTPKNKDNIIGVHYLLRVAGKISKEKD